jgi:transposase InsO family protein
MVYFLRQKDQVLKAFKEYKALVEKQLSLKIKAVRSDRGREYVGAEMIEFLAAEGILLQTTGRYSPDQNGVSERLNRTLLGRARAMLYEAGLGKEF